MKSPLEISQMLLGHELQEMEKFINRQISRIKNLDDVLLEIIPPVPNCDVKNKKSKLFRAELKKQIQEFKIELEGRRDMGKPYEPKLQYKNE